MRVEVMRSGGFAGIVRRSVLDSADLEPAEVQEVQRLVGAVDFAALGRPAATGADRFQYDVSVEHGHGTQRATVGEKDLTPELRALIDRVQKSGPSR